jgi:hypothetical protein
MPPLQPPRQTQPPRAFARHERNRSPPVCNRNGSSFRLRESPYSHIPVIVSTLTLANDRRGLLLVATRFPQPRLRQGQTLAKLPVVAA